MPGMLWITTTPGSAVQSNGSTVCMIGGSGSLPAKMARTKSIPAMSAITSVGVTPYSVLRAEVSFMGGSWAWCMMVNILSDLFQR